MRASVDGRDIYFQADGALNGDILTVACLIVWADDKTPIEGLNISQTFLSGNHLPVGDLKSFNEYYDPITGIYWFDIKVKPVTEAIDIVLQTSGTINGEQIPIKINVSLPGPSPLLVTPITFDGSVMRFEVGAKEGKLLTYPLSLKASREIDSKADAIPSKEKRIPYAFYTPINNGSEETYAVMGTAEVSGIKHNWVTRTTVKTNNGTVTAELVDENLIGVKVKLTTPNPDITVDLPVKFQLDNGTIGLTNRLQDFSIVDDVVSFDLPISDVKEVGNVKFKFHLNETTNQNAPIFLVGAAPVKRWSHGQSKVKVVVDEHTFKRNVDSVFAHAFWEDGTPVTGFSLKNVTPGAYSGVKGNQVILSRKFVPNVHKENNLTLGATIDLSAFGIEETFSFEDTIKVGNDVIPARLMSGQGTVHEDDVYFVLAVRQNNGDLFKDVKVEKYNNGLTIKEQDYDADRGFLNLIVDNTSIKTVGDRATIKLELVVTTKDDQEFHTTYEGRIKIDTPFKVISDLPIWRYRKDAVTGQIYVDITWILRGNDGHYPNKANITELKLNGVGITNYTKMYNQSFGALVASVPVTLKTGNTLYIGAVATASGLSSFVNLPPVDAKYREPGTATYLDHEFIGKEKVKVSFAIQGWDSDVPSEVQIDDESWDRVEGVKLGKTFSQYDNKRGILTVTFDVYDFNALVFKGSTAMKFNFADLTVYPISFNFTK
jgi:hypothetical protein